MDSLLRDTSSRMIADEEAGNVAGGMPNGKGKFHVNECNRAVGWSEQELLAQSRQMRVALHTWTDMRHSSASG